MDTDGPHLQAQQLSDLGFTHLRPAALDAERATAASHDALPAQLWARKASTHVCAKLKRGKAAALIKLRHRACARCARWKETGHEVVLVGVYSPKVGPGLSTTTGSWTQLDGGKCMCSSLLPGRTSAALLPMPS